MYMSSCLEACKGLIEYATISLIVLEIVGFKANKSLFVQYALFELNSHKRCEFHLF